MKNKTDDSAYMKLYKQIKKNIVDGVYPYNTKIPSKRTLASESGVSVISVAHAASQTVSHLSRMKCNQLILHWAATQTVWSSLYPSYLKQ